MIEVPAVEGSSVWIQRLRFVNFDKAEVYLRLERFNGGDHNLFLVLRVQHLVCDQAEKLAGCLGVLNLILQVNVEDVFLANFVRPFA